MRINGLDLIKNTAKRPRDEAVALSCCGLRIGRAADPGMRAVAWLNLPGYSSYLTRNVHQALRVIDECAVPFGRCAILLRSWLSAPLVRARDDVHQRPSA